MAVMQGLLRGGARARLGSAAAAYTMTLLVGARVLTIPVLPTKLAVSSPGANEKTSVVELGEVVIPRARGLRSLQWESVFPRAQAPYVTGNIMTPIEAVRAIQAARDEQKPVRLLMTGTDLDVNFRACIDNFDYEERAGEPGDIYYSIALTEWRDFSARRVVFEEGTARQEEPGRAGEPLTPDSYTVVSGDCLWMIAKSFYGDGARWPELYEANRELIGSNPNLIYPGQVLAIPQGAR